jgi:hypothetical protein
MTERPAPTDLHGADAEVLQIVALQSGDPNRIRRVLDSRNPISGALFPHVLPLLGIPTVAGSAMVALQLAADRHPGALIDALLNPANEIIVRRRVARVLSVCRSQIVVDGLLAALDDPVPDVRVQCARSLFRLQQRAPELHVDTERMLDLVRADLTRDESDLAHVFTLLSFVLPTPSLRAAYRGLRSTDTHARGMALEYLNGVLPTDIRMALMGKLGEGG